MKNVRNSVARSFYRCSLRLYDRLPLAGMLASVAVLLGVVMGHAGGLPHQWLSVQGLLRDSGGLVKPDGKYAMCFAFFGDAAGGTSLWKECKSVAVQDGLYQATLGDSIALPMISDAWLEVSVDGVALEGRVPMTGAPYAFAATQAERSGRAIHADSATWTARSVVSAVVSDSIADSVRVGKDVAVRSINGLRNEVNLSVQGSLTLDTLGDTLRIGLGSLFTRSEADGLYARKSGEIFHRLLPLPYGTSVPTCALATEGMLYYVHFNNLASQPGYLRACVATGDVDAPYAWRSISVN